MTSKNAHAAFGDTVRKTRLMLNISLRETARRLDISPSYLSSLENSRDAVTPSDDLLDKISALLGIPLPDLKLLAAGISRNGKLKSLEQVIEPGDAENIQAFYRVTKANKLSTTKAMKLFTDAVEQYQQQRKK